MVNYDLQRPNDLGMLVVVGGPGGSGSSTIAKLLARHWELHRVDAGEIMRTTNGKRNLEEYLESQVIKYPEIDKNIDRFLVKMSYYPNMLIEGKFFAAIATMMGIPCTVKIWITASVKTRVMRILEREGHLKANPNITTNSSIYKEARTELMQRQSNDAKRCLKIYHIDLSHPENFNDIVVDSSALTVGRTIKKILRDIRDDEKLALRFQPHQLKY